MTHTRRTTADPEDIARFGAIGESWWDETGPMKPLHRMGPVRLSYIRDRICAALNKKSLKGVSILDIGCGGGLIAEPLTRQGAKVTGIDASEENISVAQAHAKSSDLDVDYQAVLAEDLAARKKKYDAVIALEIVEHVADVDLFVKSCADLTKPDGVVILSTLNRTAKSYLFGIVAAEYVLRWLERGTHDWNKFLKPSELVRHAENHGLKAVNLTGMIYNPVTQEFSLSDKDLAVNYFLTAVKS